MKLTLNTDLVLKMTLDRFPVPDVPQRDWKPHSGPNYLIYDSHRDAPTGFAIRVGKKASVYLVEKQVAGKNMKLHVGLARGKKGDEQIIKVEVAREKARLLVATAKKHGANPKHVTEQIEASELSLADVFARYRHFLESKQPPAKPNSLLSVDKAFSKLGDWKSRKVRLISAAEILERFELHAVTKGHKTAAEAMGRWATSAVDKAIELEIHDAHAAGRPPSLTYNPFTILRTEGRYRSNNQLEREYAVKGIRNPLSFSSTVGPFVKAAWAYRLENPVAADFLLLTLLWGMRGGESCTFKWRHELTPQQLPVERWIDLERRVAFVADAKNRGDHEFPISPCAMEILKRRREYQAEGEVWVFPTKSAQSNTGHYSDASCAMSTVKRRAGIPVVRGHDLRRTFGGACEKLNFTDRQTKRMLGHGVAGGETLGRYTSPEWLDIAKRMDAIEELILSKAPSVYNALRPKGVARLPDPDDVVVDSRLSVRRSRRKPR
jgi:integrase